MPIPDSELIRQVRAGGKHSFAQLVDRYKNQSMTLAYRMLKNRQDAEEAVQDAFVRAYNGLEKFEGNAKFSTWLYRIVYNVCLTRIGRRKQEFPSLPFDDSLDPEILDRKPGLFREIEARDLVVHIRKVLELLPQKYATILTLFYFQHLSYDEISEVTQLPAGTVKSHLFRARALLIERLRHEFQLEHELV